MEVEMHPETVKMMNGSKMNKKYRFNNSFAPELKVAHAILARHIETKTHYAVGEKVAATRMEVSVYLDVILLV